MAEDGVHVGSGDADAGMGVDDIASLVRLRTAEGLRHERREHGALSFHRHASEGWGKRVVGENPFVELVDDGRHSGSTAESFVETRAVGSDLDAWGVDEGHEARLSIG